METKRPAAKSEAKREYKIGTVYEFEVTKFYHSKNDDGDDSIWFYLSDRESQMRYSVPAYPFQETGWEHQSILCKVIGKETDGNLHLKQFDIERTHREDFVNYYYKQGERYWFNVLGTGYDKNSKTKYYLLNDRTSNLIHRYYYSGTINLTGAVAFRVTGFRDKKYLNLEYEGSAYDFQDTKIPKEVLQNPFGHEDQHKEFKSSLVYFPGDHDNHPSVDAQMQAILQSISGFQNAEGGQLYIGITDKGDVRGIEEDYKHLNDDGDSFTYSPNPDGFERKIRKSIDRRLGKSSQENVKFNFYFQFSSNRTFCIITINKTRQPVFIDNNLLFKRCGNENGQLMGKQIIDLAEEKKNDKNKQKDFTPQMPRDCTEIDPNNPLTADSSDSHAVPLSKPLDRRFISFFDDSSFLYSKESHSSDTGVVAEISFDNKDSNIEYRCNILVKSTEDGHVQLLLANDLCKLGKIDERIKLENTPPLFKAVTVQKYDFLKVIFSNGSEKREKVFRVISLFNDETAHDLTGALEKKDILRRLSQKGVAVIPEGYKLEKLTSIPEELPSSLRFVSINGYSGVGGPIGSQMYDNTDTY